MDFSFNLNQYVKVKLNDTGVNILKEQRNKLNASIISRGGTGFGEYQHKPDSEGYTKFQMWEFMSKFGPLISLGFDQPFDMNIIITNGTPIYVDIEDAQEKHIL